MLYRVRREIHAQCLKLNKERNKCCNMFGKMYSMYIYLSIKKNMGLTPSENIGSLAALVIQ